MNKYSILIVEDEALIAASLVQTLTSLGYSVQKPVATGEDAIHSVKTKTPDLVLMDIKLAGAMDGIETAEKIRAIADIPIVYLTAFTDDTRLSKAYLTEPYGYIVKPAHKHVLHGTIEMALYKHGLDRKLKESEEKYRSIIDSMQDAYFRADIEGRIILASPSAAHLLRYDSVNDLIGLPAAIMYRYPEERQKIIRIAKERGEVHDYICEGMRKDGTSFWGSMNVQFTFDSKGEVTGTDGFIRDITERTRAEEALRESERELKVLIKSMINAFVLFESVFDDDGNVVSFRFVFINDAYERITGVKNDEVRGKTMHEVWPGTEASWIKAYGDVAVTGVSSSFEMYHEPTKKLYYCNVYRPGERQDRICVIFEDITDRKRAEETLRKSEEKFRNVFDWANDAILLHTLSTDGAPGRFIDANLVACRMLGYSRDELLTMEPLDIVPPEHHPQLGDIIRHAQTKDTILFEARLRHKDGTTFPVESSAHLVNYEGKRIWISHIRDITERKRIEAAFQTMVRSMVGTTGLNSLQKITENVSSWLGAECVMVGEIQPDNQTVRVLSMLLDGKEIHDFSYTLKGTPCDNVVEKGFCLYPDHVIQLFPESKDLVELNIRGYIGTPLRNSGGQVMGILCALFRSPITTSPAVQEIMNIIAVKAAAEIERKRAEEALRESEERFRTIIHSMQFGVIIIDAQTHTILDANKKALEIIGGTSDIVTGSVCHRFICPAELGRCPVTDLKQTVDSSERVLLTLQGKKIPIIKSVISTTLEGKEVLIESFVDITDRKQMEEILRESEERFRSLFDSALDMIQIIRPDGSFLHVNPAWKKTLGYSDEDVRTKSVFDIFHPDSLAHCSIKFRQLLSGAEALNIEAQFLTKDKKTISVEGNCNPELKNGTVVSIRGIFHDITERKKVELALRQVNKQLNLLASITRHDIRNQLLALRGYLELSREYLDDKKTLCDFLGKMEKSAKTIEHQIMFTKDYQELGAAAPIWQNVNEGIRKAMVALPLRAVHVEPDPANPEVYSDPLFEKVFYNLIDNALKYGSDQMKTIRVSSLESDASLTIVCEDDGVGITAGDKKHLFTRGFGKNTGLGLFLSREILSITGITITENGIPGKGARFEMTVPNGGYRFMETEGK